MWKTVAVLALLMMPLSALAKDPADGVYQYSNIIYTPPEGWEVGGTNDRGYITLRTDDDVKELYATLSIHATQPGRDGKAAVKEWMDADMEEDDLEIVQVIDTVEGEENGTAITLYGRQVKDRRDYLQVYITVQLPDRAELFKFQTAVRNEEDAAIANTLINDDVVPLLKSLKYVSTGEPPLLGAPTAGELDGVWWGSHIQLKNGLNGMEMDLVRRVYTFYANGRFYYGIPPEGVVLFDYDEAVRVRTARTGNYSLDGDTLALQYADGRTRELRYNNGMIVDGRTNMHRASVPGDGYRFEGTRSTFSYTAISTGLGSTGGVSSSAKQVFRRDGTYTSSGFTGASGSFDSGGGFAGSSKEEEAVGQYEVKDGQLHLTEPDGTKKVWTILLQADDEEGDTIVVQGEFLK